MATTSSESGCRSRIALRVCRPMRPKPLIPIRVLTGIPPCGLRRGMSRRPTRGDRQGRRRRSLTIGREPISETSSPKSRGHEAHPTRGNGEGAMVDLVRAPRTGADGGKRCCPRPRSPGDSASSQAPRRVRPPLPRLVHRPRGRRVAGVGRLGHERRVHHLRRGGKLGEDRSLASLQEQSSVPGDGRPRADGLCMTGHSVTAERAIQVDREMTDLAGGVVAPLERLPTAMMPPPMPVETVM